MAQTLKGPLTGRSAMAQRGAARRASFQRPWCCAVALSCLSACASDSETIRGSLLLQVRSTDSRLDAFATYVTGEDGKTQAFSCGLDDVADAAERCTSNGIQLPDVSGPVEITVKARGYHFWSGTLDPRNAKRADAGRVSEVTLQGLAPFEHTADYDTGFEPESGLATFGADAVTESTELGEVQLVKFYITDLLTSPSVYFQNTRKHPLHYTFARDVLHQAAGLDAFESATYSGANRTAMAGTLLYRPQVTLSSGAYGGELSAPISVTFFPSDDLTAEQAIVATRLLEERLGFAPLTGGSHRVVYEPAGTVQEAAVLELQPQFDQSGTLWITLSEVYGGLSLQILNPGVAYGTLRLLTPEELETKVVSYTDLLVLTRLPNELPLVGGTITGELQTPLSHVNVAARNRGTPNIALLGAENDRRITQYLDHLVRFEAGDGNFSLTEATLDEAEAFWKAQEHEPFVPPYDDTTQGLLAFDELHFADSLRIGVKAANLAELAQLLGDRAPDGFAVPFYYYDQFMRTEGVTADACAPAIDDCVSEGRATTLCAEVQALCEPVDIQAESFYAYVERVLSNQTVRSDSNLREGCLDTLRYLMRHTPVDAEFATQLDDYVNTWFGTDKVRIRSSTNTEDLENFSGAGLYDSYSANSAESGPASEQIRKVWASVWNYAAYEERAYWNIDQMAVRMGCAIHLAFSTEAANGVVITQNIAEPSVAGIYVNVQKGEVSVTNPTNGAIPEIFSIIPAPSGLQVRRQRLSNLSPTLPLLADAEIQELYQASAKAQDRFAELYEQSASAAAFDVEFKFNEPDRSLVIKQIRPYTTNATE